MHPAHWEAIEPEMVVVRCVRLIIVRAVMGKNVWNAIRGTIWIRGFARDVPTSAGLAMMGSTVTSVLGGMSNLRNGLV